MEEKDYAELSTRDKLAHWEAYQPHDLDASALKRRALRHLTDKLNAETAEHLKSLAF